jgi:hypothetical protein
MNGMASVLPAELTAAMLTSTDVMMKRALFAAAAYDLLRNSATQQKQLSPDAFDCYGNQRNQQVQHQPLGSICSGAAVPPPFLMKKSGFGEVTNAEKDLHNFDLRRISSIDTSGSCKQLVDGVYNYILSSAFCHVLYCSMRLVLLYAFTVT